MGNALEVYGLTCNTKGIQKHFSSLGAPLKARWSWGSVHNASGSVILIVWEDALDAGLKSRTVAIQWAAPADPRARHGHNQRNEHISRIQHGATALAVAATSGKNGGIKSFDADHLLLLGGVSPRQDKPGTWEAKILDVLPAREALSAAVVTPAEESLRPEAALRLVKARQGQPQFRNALLAAYESRCAITGCAVEPALEAAHIQPYSQDGASHVKNGLLLRADIHTLFDFHFIAIDPDDGMRIHVHRDLLASYSDFSSKTLTLPHNAALAPDPNLLRDHFMRFREKETKAAHTPSSAKDL